MTLMSLQAGILIKSNNGKSMLWGKSKESIITAPPGVSIVDHFSEYLTTDDGLLVQEEIKKVIYGEVLVVGDQDLINTQLLSMILMKMLINQ